MLKTSSRPATTRPPGTNLLKVKTCKKYTKIILILYNLKYDNYYFVWHLVVSPEDNEVVVQEAGNNCSYTSQYTQRSAGTPPPTSGRVSPQMWCKLTSSHEPGTFVKIQRGRSQMFQGESRGSNGPVISFSRASSRAPAPGTITKVSESPAGKKS